MTFDEMDPLRRRRRDSVAIPELDPSAYSFAPELRYKAWVLLEFPFSSTKAHLLGLSIIFMILFSVVIFTIETLPQYHRSGDPFWLAMEWITALFFTFEYLLRLFSSPSTSQFLKSRMNVIDFLSFFPFYIELLISGKNHHTAAYSILRILRIIRMFRLFKLTRYSHGIRVFTSSMKKSFSALLLLFMFTSMSVVLFGTVLYYAERGEWDEEVREYVRDIPGPDREFYNPFGSIPDSFWFTIVTLATVGYGDAAPITVWGKLTASMTMLVGIMIIALPVTIIGINFAKVYEADDELEFTPSHLARRRDSDSAISLDEMELPEMAETDDMLQVIEEMQGQLQIWSHRLSKAKEAIERRKQ